MTTNHWTTWLDTQVKDNSQRQLLAEALTEAGHSVRPPNAPKHSISLLASPVEDFLIDFCPPFVDVHNLIGLYNQLAFRNNLLVKGPKGDGKTLSFTHYCHVTETPLVTIECSQETKAGNLIGGFTDLGVFQLGPLPTAIDIANNYGRCVLAFEEINALTPQIQKLLNALTDFRKFITIPQIGRTYRLNEGAKLWPVATMNPSVYGGTYDLNEDLRSRWQECEVGYPKHGQEVSIVKAHYPTMVKNQKDNLDKCIRFAVDTRQQGTGYALSTRDVVDLIGLLEVMSLNDALQLTVCKFEGEDRETAIKRVGSSFAGVKPKQHWGASK